MKAQCGQFLTLAHVLLHHCNVSKDVCPTRFHGLQPMNMLMPIHYATLLDACGTVDTHEPAQQRWTPQETLRRPVAHPYVRHYVTRPPSCKAGQPQICKRPLRGHWCDRLHHWCSTLGLAAEKKTTPTVTPTSKCYATERRKLTLAWSSSGSRNTETIANRSVLRKLLHQNCNGFHGLPRFAQPVG